MIPALGALTYAVGPVLGGWLGTVHLPSQIPSGLVDLTFDSPSSIVPNMCYNLYVLLKCRGWYRSYCVLHDSNGVRCVSESSSTLYKAYFCWRTRLYTDSDTDSDTDCTRNISCHSP